MLYSVVSQFRFHFLAGIGVLIVWALAAAPAHARHPLDAQSARLCAELRRGPSNQIGFTLGNLFDPKLWVSVAAPLQSRPLDHIDEAIHRVPRPGVQVELLTPGDAGITLHWRW